MARWTRQDDGSYLFTPVTAAGDNLHHKITVATDPLSGTTHLALVSKYGEVTGRKLRPADARRIGTALIEAAALADAGIVLGEIDATA